MWQQGGCQLGEQPGSDVAEVAGMGWWAREGARIVSDNVNPASRHFPLRFCSKAVNGRKLVQTAEASAPDEARSIT